MKRIVKITSLLLALVIAALMGVSCGVDYTDDEIKKVARELIEASFGINDIYFGKGLPISEEDSEEAKKFAEENGLELDNIQFLPVTEESPYTSIAMIKEATAKVYSRAYCESLYKTAFEGFSLQDGAQAVYAKYMEDGNGTLTVRIDLAEKELPARTYDYSTIKVKSKKEKSVKVEIVSYLDGKKEEKPAVFTLVKEENGWRLDTPTY
ncbi:MAG: hypothetical protein IKL24_01990 [Clostridia bacterium]|nr:hypothetical protein [Clostridia bacterium]